MAAVVSYLTLSTLIAEKWLNSTRAGWCRSLYHLYGVPGWSTVFPSWKVWFKFKWQGGGSGSLQLMSAGLDPLESHLIRLPLFVAPWRCLLNEWNQSNAQGHESDFIRSFHMTSEGNRENWASWQGVYKPRCTPFQWRASTASMDVFATIMRCNAMLGWD
jgi:hypothetical protein